MSIRIDVAYAQIQQKGKGEDDRLVRPLAKGGTIQLLAVADGLSLSGGKKAARWTIKCLRRLSDFSSARAIYRGIEAELARARHQIEPSETTLTCGILRKIDLVDEVILRFEYFAIGDSPIWKVVRGDSKYPFQRVLVNGALYPSETARVYSTLRLHERDIKGSVSFGEIDVGLDEVLVVCTDGIPEREIFVRDFINSQTMPSGTIDRPTLCRWLFQQRRYDNKKLQQILKNYDNRGVLFDDATIIAARLIPKAKKVKDSEIPLDKPQSNSPHHEREQDSVDSREDNNNLAAPRLLGNVSNTTSENSPLVNVIADLASDQGLGVDVAVKHPGDNMTDTSLTDVDPI